MLYRQSAFDCPRADMKRQGIKEADMRSGWVSASGICCQKTLEQGGTLFYARIKQVYQQLLETDIAIKTGKYSENLALNILIAELCSVRRWRLRITNPGLNIQQRRLPDERQNSNR